MHLHIQPFIKSFNHSPIYPQSFHFHSEPPVYSFTFPHTNPSISPFHYPPDSNPSTRPHFHPPVFQIQPLTYPPIYPPNLPLTHQPIHPPEVNCSYFSVFTCSVVYDTHSCQITFYTHYNNGPVHQSESNSVVCLNLACCCCSVCPRMLLTSDN